MKTIVALMLVLFAAYPCSGKYFPGRFFRSESRLPFPETALKDEDCKDDPNYEDGCPEKAAIDGYCKKHEDFMREKCAKSCGFCSEGIEKSPAPIDCKDNRDYADGCPEKAAMDGYCKKHEDFMREKCAKSCGFCSEGIEKLPAPIDCKDDPDYADGCPEKAAMGGYCKNHEDFMREKCAKSCGFCSEVPLEP